MIARLRPVGEVGRGPAEVGAVGGQNVRGHNFLGHRHQIEEGVNAEGVLCLFHDLGLRAAAGGPSSALA